MKPIGYIIYQIWDMKWKWSGDEDWTIDPVSPIPEFKKRIYTTEASAKEAVEQMLKHNNGDAIEDSINYKNFQYFILPIFTPEEEYAKVFEVFKERKLKSVK